MQSQQEKLQKLAKGNWYVRAYILACLNGHEKAARLGFSVLDFAAQVVVSGPEFQGFQFAVLGGG